VLSLKGHKIPWNVILHTFVTFDCKDKGHPTTCLDRAGETVV